MGHIQTPVETSDGDVGLMSGVPVRGVEDAEGPPGEFEEEDFRCNVIFGEDLRKPAFGDVNITVTVRVEHEVGPTDVEIMTIDILQVHGDRVFTRIVVINVAGPMRGEIRTAILIVLDLVLSAGKRPYKLMYRYLCKRENPEVIWSFIPFVETDDILNKQQRLVWQKQGARRCSEFDSGEHGASRCCRMG